MKSKEGNYKNRTFPVSSPIGGGKINFPGLVLESYGHVCLVEEKKAYTQGRFRQLGIYKVMLYGVGEEQIVPMQIDYEMREGAPARHAAPDQEVREMYEKIIGKMMIADSEEEIKKDRQIREDQKRAGCNRSC
jgi:hypothetical protein